VLSRIRELGKKAGAVLDPASPIAFVEQVLHLCDVVLVMTVNPGFGGQDFLPETLPKVRELRRLCESKGLDPWIEVDGGQNAENAGRAIEAGPTPSSPGRRFSARATTRRRSRESGQRSALSVHVPANACAGIARHSGAVDSSAKSGVGTALTARSRVWFTLSHGILNEIYYPRIDQACTRDFGLIVTDGQSFFSEEKRDTKSTLEPIADGVPAFAVTSTCTRGRYRLKKLVLTDPDRDVVLQRIDFQALDGGNRGLPSLRPPRAAPGQRGAGNSAWIDDYKGVPMLFAEGSGTSARAGLLGPLSRANDRFRRRLGRLAGSLPAFRAALAL
jgi:hypothetical protein